MPAANDRGPAVLVSWVIWVSLVISIIVYQFTLGGGMLTGANAAGGGPMFPVILGASQVLVATVLRWTVIPQVAGARQRLILLIIGLALSEAAEFYGIFLVAGDLPQTKMGLFGLSLLSALQFAPFYASHRPPSPFRTGE